MRRKAVAVLAVGFVGLGVALWSACGDGGIGTDISDISGLQGFFFPAADDGAWGPDGPGAYQCFDDTIAVAEDSRLATFREFGIQTPPGETVILGFRVLLRARNTSQPPLGSFFRVQLKAGEKRSEPRNTPDGAGDNLPREFKNLFFGGEGDTWGQSWAVEELADGVFRSLSMKVRQWVVRV